MSLPVRLISCVSLLLWACAAQAQMYARFGSPLEKEHDKQSYAVADISPDLPTCKRNDAAWWAQVQAYEKMWNDPRRINDVSWRVARAQDTLPSFEAWPRELRRPSQSGIRDGVPQFGAAQGVTWIDIDGDGWCDVVLSVQPEPVKRPGLPIILANASAAFFFDPTSQTFKTGKQGLYSTSSRGGEITSAFTFYYNRKARRVETVERIFSSGMRYSSKGWEELHGRLMFKGAMLTEPLCTKAGDGSESCIAYTVMNEEFERVLDALRDTDPREAAIRQRLMTEAEAATRSKSPR